jgi:putative heme-binding domain-containing protein
MAITSNYNTNDVGSTWIFIMKRLSVFAIVIAASTSLLCAEEPPTKKTPPRPVPKATAPEKIKIKEGFQVELLYTVPPEDQGSWVSLCHDHKGRLIVSDQDGGLFRVTPPPIGHLEPVIVEKVPVDLGEAQGLVWANDSLYVVVNHAKKYKSGLYRVVDTDDDDQLDDVKLLREFNGNGEHGPHAVVLGPDKQSLYLVIGNHTKLTKIDSSRVPRCWAEDLIVPRMWDPRGHAVGIKAPGGHILKTDLDGLKWELFSIGYRNCYDAAFDPNGELFTYDSDMEWDINTPWYRPTRVCHVTSGSEYGWRSGSGKWPTYYPDSLPPVVNIGPGSPTGVTFGTGAKFPAKYQQALFICDWSYGKLYAVHLTPEGASFSGEPEEFLAGVPLPLTDIVVNPMDGALYFTIGGRRTTSGLYRVTYLGKDTPQNENVPGIKESVRQRRWLEQSHQSSQPQNLEQIWQQLGNDDRFIRFAARTALEHLDPELWYERAMSEKNHRIALAALLAVPRLDKRGFQPAVIQALAKIDWDQLTIAERLELVRAYELTLLRMGPYTPSMRQEIIRRFDPHLPNANRELNSEIGKLLAYVDAPSVVPKLMESLAKAPSQEEQMDYATTLRTTYSGWTPELRKQYFEWFHKAAGYRGGASFAGFVKKIKLDAIETLDDFELEELLPVLAVRPAKTPAPAKPRPFVKKWTMDEVLPLVENGLKNRNFETGKELFAATRCTACHRFQDDGGVGGPDLTMAGGRFSIRDLLESIIEPDKTISDQYAAQVMTTTSGQLITGRVVNLNGDTLYVSTDMLDPSHLTQVKRSDVESMEPSKVSMMPAGLLDTCTIEEIKDLLAYILSRGNRTGPMFKQP